MKTNKINSITFKVYQAVAEDTNITEFPVCRLTRIGEVVDIKKLSENMVAKQIRSIIMKYFSLKRAVTKVDEVKEAVHHALTKVTQRSDFVFYTKDNDCACIVVELVIPSK